MNLGMMMEMHLEMEPSRSRSNDEVSLGRPCAQRGVNCHCGSPCGCLSETDGSFPKVKAGIDSNALMQEVA